MYKPKKHLFNLCINFSLLKITVEFIELILKHNENILSINVNGTSLCLEFSTFHHKLATCASRG